LDQGLDYYDGMRDDEEDEYCDYEDEDSEEEDYDNGFDCEREPGVDLEEKKECCWQTRAVPMLPSLPEAQLSARGMVCF